MVARLRRVAGMSLLWLMLLAAPCVADQVQLKDGRRYDGRIVAESDDEISIELLNGSVAHLSRTEIAEVVRGKSVAEQVDERLEALRPEDPAGYADLGSFCLEHKPLQELGRRCLWAAAWLEPARYAELLVRIGDSLSHPRDKGVSWHLYQRARLADPTHPVAWDRIEKYPADQRTAAGTGDPLYRPGTSSRTPETEMPLHEQAQCRLLRVGTRLYEKDVADGRIVWHSGQWMTPAEKRAASGAPGVSDATPGAGEPQAVDLPRSIDPTAPPTPETLFRTVFARGDGTGSESQWIARGSGFGLIVPRERGRTAAARIVLVPEREAEFRFPPGVSAQDLPGSAEIAACYRVTRVAVWREGSPGGDVLITCLRIVSVEFVARDRPGGVAIARWR